MVIYPISDARPRAAPGVVHGAARGLRRRPAELRRERAALPLDGACGAPIPPGTAGGRRGGCRLRQANLRMKNLAKIEDQPIFSDVP